MDDVSLDPSNTILFVGAGVSTVLGLPSWPKLIDEIAKQLGYDARVFRLLGSYLSLAEFYELERGSIGPLRSWMDVEWHHKGVNVSKSDVHEAIVKAGFKKIYTTNFDRWLERAFEHWKVPHRRLLTVNDLAATQDGSVEIVKFHGDFDDDKTLILTETSYFDRLNFEAPMDMMLRADAVRHPILFIGYSLSDINMRYLFHKLAKVWQDAAIGGSRPASYIYMTRPNPVEEKIFKKWGITPIIDMSGTPTSALAEFLKKVGQKK